MELLHQSIYTFSSLLWRSFKNCFLLLLLLQPFYSCVIDFLDLSSCLLLRHSSISSEFWENFWDTLVYCFQTLIIPVIFEFLNTIIIIFFAFENWDILVLFSCQDAGFKSFYQGITYIQKSAWWLFTKYTNTEIKKQMLSVSRTSLVPLPVTVPPWVTTRLT